MANLLFYLFGFSCFAYVFLKKTCLVKSKPVKQKVSSTVILPFTQWLFSVASSSIIQPKTKWCDDLVKNYCFNASPAAAAAAAHNLCQYCSKYWFIPDEKMWISASCEYEGAAGKEVFEVVCGQRRIARWGLSSSFCTSPLTVTTWKTIPTYVFLLNFFVLSLKTWMCCLLNSCNLSK